MEYLYKITCLINNKFYIGSTNDIQYRIEQHKRGNNKYFHSEMYDDFEKYGEKNFKIEVLLSDKDKILVSRYESKIIRRNIGNPFMYNTTHGASGRRVFNEEDVIFIRTMYNSKKYRIQDFYDIYYKDIVTYRAFQKVWLGETFKDIMSEVFTEENRNWYFSLGQSRTRGESLNFLLTYKDIKFIKRCKYFSISLDEIYYRYYDGIFNKKLIKDIYTGRRWGNICKRK